MLDYVRLLEANNAIQTVGDDTDWLCVTRTVRESKLFPMPPYMLLSYLNCFYRYPDLLRKIEARMKAEEIGDRARGMGGMLDPADAADDVSYVMDFWRRFKLAQHAGENRFICDTAAKYAPDDPDVAHLYQLEQAGTPLAGCGAGLTRADVETLRSAQ